MGLTTIGEGTEQIGDGVLSVGRGLGGIKDSIAHGVAEVLGGGKIGKIIGNAVNVGTEIALLKGGRYSIAALANGGKFLGNFATLRRKTAFTNDLVKFGAAFLEPAKDIGYNSYKILRDDKDKISIKDLSIASYSSSPSGKRYKDNSKTTK